MVQGDTEMKKFLNEFSKFAYVTMFCTGIICVLMYYVALLCGKEPDSQIVKWAIDLMVVPYFGYITYQLGLKNSLNKNGLFLDGDKVRKL